MSKHARLVNSTPDFSSLNCSSNNFHKDWWMAETYLRTEVPLSTLKKEAIVWLDSRGISIDLLKNTGDWQFNTMGKLCYVLNRGGSIPETGESWLDKKIKELFAKAKEEFKNSQQLDKTKETLVVSKKDIHNTLYEQAAKVAGEEFESCIDSFIKNPDKFNLSIVDPKKVFLKHDLTPGHVQYIIKFYQKEIEEIDASINSSDFSEYYNKYSINQIKKLRAFYKIIVDSALAFIAVSSPKKRIARKPKDVKRAVIKLKYLKTYDELNIKSIDPKLILNKKQLWAYNTKTKKLIRYVSDTGFDISGTTLKNVNIDKSIQKNVKHPKELFRGFSIAIKKEALLKIFENISSKPLKLSTTRTNEYLILLNVY